MNKYLLTLLVIFCSSASQSSLAAGTELHIIYTYNHEYIGRSLRDFGASAGIPIKVEFSDQGDLKTNSLKLMELNTAPDAVVIPADHVGLYRFIKYSEVDPHLFKATIPKRIWDVGMSDGKIYGAPLIQGNHLMLYYNKSLVKEPARDWKTMFAQKTEFDAKGITTIAWSYAEAFWFLPFLGAYGGWPITDGKVELNTPAMAAALDAYKELYTKHLPYPDCSSECALDLFKSGKLAYTINGEWAGANLFKALGDNLGVSAIPMAQDKKMVSAFSTYVIAFPNNSLNGPKRAALIQLVNYLQSPKVQQQIWEQSRAIPVEATAFTYAQKNAQGYLQKTLELMVDTKPLPADQAMTFIWDAITKGTARHREGNADSKAAALYMQQLAERNIRNAKTQAELDTRSQAH